MWQQLENVIKISNSKIKVKKSKESSNIASIINRKCGLEKCCVTKNKTLQETKVSIAALINLKCFIL